MSPPLSLDIRCMMEIKGGEDVEKSAVSTAVVFGVIIFFGGLRGGYTFGEILEVYLAIIGGFTILNYLFGKLSAVIKLKIKEKRGQN